MTELSEAKLKFGNIRPIHKRNLARIASAVEQNKRHPEPMTFFHKREKNKEIPETALPKPQITLGTLDKVAEAVSAWDNSDPFSGDRARLYAKQGYIDPGEVIKELSMRVLARKAAKAKEVDDAKRG